MENNQQQYLALIAEMINTARQEFNDMSYIYLTWGWAVCIASLAEFIMMKMGLSYHYISWAILIPVALIVQFVGMARQKKKERIKTHIDKVTGYVWIAVGVSLGIVLFSMNTMQLSTYPVLILLYGIGTFISGGLMDLKPMVAGGICCWVIGLVAFYMPFEYQLLMLSLSVILSYIIPGHILKNRFRQNV